MDVPRAITWRCLLQMVVALVDPLRWEEARGALEGLLPEVGLQALLHSLPSASVAEARWDFRYKDAASEALAGFPPPLKDGIPVDLTILCPPGSDEVEGYPEWILPNPGTAFRILAEGSRRGGWGWG